MHRYATFAVVALITLVSAASADAMVLRFGESYSLEQGTVVEDDLYVVGEQIQITGTTSNDIIAIGSSITQRGVVKEDAIYGGGQVVITGDVEGDLRVIGGKILVQGNIKEDAVLIGGTVTIEPEAIIEGDLFVVGEYLDMEGTVYGFTDARVRTVEITGDVQGDAHLTTSESVSITGQAVVGGDVIYKAPREAFVSETAIVTGELEFHRTEAMRTESTVNLASLIVKLLIAIVAAVVAVWLFPRHARSLTDHALSEGSGMRIVKGFLIVFAWPILAVLVMITVLGFVPGMVMLLLYALTIGLATVLGSIISGALLATWLKRPEDGLQLGWVALGATALTLLSLLPVAGWLVRTLIFLLAFWTLCIGFVNTFWKTRKEEVLQPQKTNETNDEKDSAKEEDKTSK